MQLKMFFLLTFYFLIVDGYKILIFNPKFGGSHVAFAGKFADILASAGHEVVVYQPIFNEKIPFTGSKDERIRYYTTPKDPTIESTWNDQQSNIWEGETFKKLINLTVYYRDSHKLFCRSILDDSETLQKLREENFDLGLSEVFEACGFGVFELIGLKKYISTTSSTMMVLNVDLLGIKHHASYVPSLFSLDSDEMNLFQRITNLFQSFMEDCWGRQFMIYGVQEAITEKIPGFDLQQAISKSAFHFINTDEFIDYPQAITHKVIYVGGLSQAQSRPLSQELSNIFNTAKKGVIYFSLGTVAQSSHMPLELKQAFLEAFSAFPDITFLWKYENDTNEVVKGYSNVITKKWFPQNDILDHPRLLAFISHGGMNSVIEATTKGVPMICIPVFGDQYRNAILLKRRGTAVILKKDALSKAEIIHAIKTIITHESYNATAKLLSKLVKKKPMNSIEKVIKYSEFAAEFGDVGSLQTGGVTQSWMVLHSVDVFLVISGMLLVIIFGLYFAVKKLLNVLRSLVFGSQKPKKD